MKPMYDLKIAVRSDGRKMLAIEYDANSISSKPIVITVVDDGKNVEFQEVISSECSCAFVGPIEPGMKYTLSLTDGEFSHEEGFSISQDGKVNTLNIQNEEVLRNKAATSSYLYYVYSATSSTPIIKESLFQAIEQARVLGSGAYVKFQNTTEVYRHGISGRYYRYQFTASYGYVSSKSDADAWISGYNYAYVIQSSNGRVYATSYKTLKGTAPTWALEPNSGGYYYQYSHYNKNYNKAEMRVNLTQAKLKLSENANQPFNAYAFINVHNANAGYDLGIIFSNTSHTWNMVCMPYNSGSVTYSEGNTQICAASQNSNGEWVANADVKIAVELTSTGLKATITNISNNLTKNITVVNSKISSSAVNQVFVPAVSYVPSAATELMLSTQTPDFRCGGYFKNVKLSDCKVFNKSGSSYVFYATSSATDMSLVYNDDCCTVTATSSATTVNIAYDKPYRS